MKLLCKKPLLIKDKTLECEDVVIIDLKALNIYEVEPYSKHNDLYGVLYNGVWVCHFGKNEHNLSEYFYLTDVSEMIYKN